jgi:phosphoglycolate phosphatase-like HAD superfamily hydrolase
MCDLRGVLLDVDGTLIDSNMAHALSLQAALEMAGYRHSVEQILPLIGMDAEKLLQVLNSNLTPQQVTRIRKMKQELYVLEHLPSLKPFPGAAELVQQLARNNIPVAIARSASDTELVPTLQTIGISYLLSTAAKSSEINDSNTSTDILEAAAGKLSIPLKSLVLIGDTPYDVAAASRNDMPSIGFLCGGWSQQALKGAVAFYAGPWELLANWDTSLLGELSTVAKSKQIPQKLRSSL